MAKSIKKIVKKLPKTDRQIIRTRPETLIKEERGIVLLPQSKVMADLMLRAQGEPGKLGLNADQLKSAVNQRSKSRLKTRYPGVFNDKT
jgi:hypothetical protein